MCSDKQIQASDNFEGGMQGEDMGGVYTTCIEFCFVLLIFFRLCVCVLSSGIKPFNTLEALMLLELRVYGVTIMGSHSINLPQFSCLFYDLS